MTSPDSTPALPDEPVPSPSVQPTRTGLAGFLAALTTAVILICVGHLTAEQVVAVLGALGGLYGSLRNG